MSLEALKMFFSEDNTKSKESIKQDTNKPIKTILTAHIEIDKRNREAYKVIAENIKKSEHLKIEINKGIQAGQPIYKLLLKSIECISLMTGDKIFYTMSKDNLQTIYEILGEPEAKEIESQEVRSRLNKLNTAYELEADTRAKQRIKNAIKAHQEKLNKLQ
ncbi:MAG: hypothetical protein ACOYJ1_13210 [Peptococcales bacterium]|jgi:hypothetical protein